MTAIEYDASQPDFTNATLTNAISLHLLRIHLQVCIASKTSARLVTSSYVVICRHILSCGD